MTALTGSVHIYTMACKKNTPLILRTLAGVVSF